jgi:NAD(P)-dependent dehydrogenase (short-subunit alcohol dehydrogenase family)
MPRPERWRDRLKAKVAIVTGGGNQGDDEAPGVGAAIALAFAREGALLCIVDRDQALADRTRRSITTAGGEAIAVIGDVTKAQDCERAVADTLAAFGKLDLLVNNVGAGAVPSSLEAINEARWRGLVDANLTSAFLMSRAALPALAGHASAIVNIASNAGLRALGSAGYGAAKAGLVGLTRDVAIAHGPDGVRVNALSPGAIFTPMAAAAAGIDEARRKLRRDVSPLGIEGDAWDVALAAVFLASDEARFITGQCLAVDGGVGSMAVMAGLDLVRARADPPET